MKAPRLPDEDRCTNSYLVVSAPPCFLPCSQPGDDTRSGPGKCQFLSLLPRRGGKRRGEKEEREKKSVEEEKETGCEGRGQGEGLWSAGGSQLLFLSTVSHRINQAPTLERPGNCLGHRPGSRGLIPVSQPPPPHPRPSATTRHAFKLPSFSLATWPKQSLRSVTSRVFTNQDKRELKSLVIHGVHLV